MPKRSDNLLYIFGEFLKMHDVKVLLQSTVCRKTLSFQCIIRRPSRKFYLKYSLYGNRKEKLFHGSPLPLHGSQKLLYSRTHNCFQTKDSLWLLKGKLSPQILHLILKSNINTLMQLIWLVLTYLIIVSYTLLKFPNFSTTWLKSSSIA